MLIFMLRRVLSGALLIAVISFLVFALLYVNSGDIARTILGETATEETVAKKTAELGLDRPLLVQYGDWLSSAIVGDLGRSWYSSQPITIGLSSRIGVTLSLVIGTVLVSTIISVVLGVVAARRGGAVDGAIQLLTLLGLAIPGFVIALYLVLLFAVQLGWFRATGFTPLTTSLAGWASSVTLPIAALSTTVIATVAQQVRGAVVDALAKDYVRTLRSRGLPETSVVYKHVLRNAGGPALAVLAVQFVGLLGGAVIVEQIFSVPGLGQLAVQATTQGDIPSVMGVVIVFAILVIIANILVDLGQAALNPKVRLR
ncbi:dipeptide/oligopeptide/nickel ABC transporter permease [Microbacterium sp. HM58-2]|nr:dipeptide/oligopeptide/nickel ABC transporter permease [Microbacterium sp. HM58-2]